MQRGFDLALRFSQLGWGRRQFHVQNWVGLTLFVGFRSANHVPAAVFIESLGLGVLLVHIEVSRSQFVYGEGEQRASNPLAAGGGVDE